MSNGAGIREYDADAASVATISVDVAIEIDLNVYDSGAGIRRKAIVSYAKTFTFTRKANPYTSYPFTALPAASAVVPDQFSVISGETETGEPASFEFRSPRARMLSDLDVSTLLLVGTSGNDFEVNWEILYDDATPDESGTWVPSTDEFGGDDALRLEGTQISTQEEVLPSAVVVGQPYKILQEGTTTNWTAMGAPTGTVDEIFVATATGSGDGVAGDMWDGKNIIQWLAAFGVQWPVDNVIYFPGNFGTFSARDWIPRTATSGDDVWQSDWPDFGSGASSAELAIDPITGPSGTASATYTEPVWAGDVDNTVTSWAASFTYDLTFS